MRIFALIIIFFAFFDLFTQLPIMTPLAVSYGATPFLAGLVVGMFSFANMFGNVTSGILTDKTGPFRMVFIGLLFSGISLFLYQFAGNVYWLLAVRFIHGLTGGLIIPAGFTMVANRTAKEKKGKGSAISGAFVGLAAILGPAFSGILASKTSELTVLKFTSVAMIVLSVLSFFILRKASDAMKGTKVQKGERPIRQLFRTLPIVKAYAGAFFLMFSQGVLAYMLPLKVADLGSDAQTSGMLLSTFGIVAVMVFLLPTNRLFDRIPPVRTLVFGMSLMGVGLLLISMSQTLSLLYVMMGLYGIGFAFLFPSINSLLIGATTEDNRGKAYGYFYAFFSIGVVAGSGVTGVLQLTADGGFLLTGIVLLIVAAVFGFWKQSLRPAY